MAKQKKIAKDKLNFFNSLLAKNKKRGNHSITCPALAKVKKQIKKELKEKTIAVKTLGQKFNLSSLAKRKQKSPEKKICNSKYKFQPQTFPKTNKSDKG